MMVVRSLVVLVFEECTVLCRLFHVSTKNMRSVDNSMFQDVKGGFVWRVGCGNKAGDRRSEVWEGSRWCEGKGEEGQEVSVHEPPKVEVTCLRI